MVRGDRCEERRRTNEQRNSTCEVLETIELKLKLIEQRSAQTASPGCRTGLVRLVPLKPSCPSRSSPCAVICMRYFGLQYLTRVPRTRTLGNDVRCGPSQRWRVLEGVMVGQEVGGGTNPILEAHIHQRSRWENRSYQLPLHRQLCERC